MAAVCVDFAACFRQLERQGYQGPYMMEMWYAPGQDWAAEIRTARNFIREQFHTAVGEETA